MAIEPGSKPKSSPIPTLTDGAVWKTTKVSGSLIALHTLGTSSTSYSAPTGHTVIHFPQSTQVDSSVGLLKACPISVSYTHLDVYKRQPITAPM